MNETLRRMSDPAASAARSAPAATRNREPILAVLSPRLPAHATVFEVASGTGEHAVHVAAARADILWRPSDADPAKLPGIAAHAEKAGTANVLAPLMFDVMRDSWPARHSDAVVCINMIHIAPWGACRALLAGGARGLAPGGFLYLYGPFAENGKHTAESNAAFDASLRARDPSWGVRDLADVAAAARTQGLVLAERIAMPANNLSVVFRRLG